MQFLNGLSLVFPEALHERREGKLRGTVDDPQQRTGRAARRALALLPVACRVDGDADALGERRLGKPDLVTNPAGVRGGSRIASASS